MTKGEALKQLEDLRARCEGFINEDPVWECDVEALNIAINALRKQEVII